MSTENRSRPVSSSKEAASKVKNPLPRDIFLESVRSSAGETWSFDDGGIYRVARMVTTEQRTVLYRLRFEVYCGARMNSLPARDYPDGLEVDAYDPSEADFAGLHRGCLTGTVRLIGSRNGKFLMESGPEAFPLVELMDAKGVSFDRTKTLELSRIIAPSVKDDPELGAFAQLELILECACRWSLDHGITLWVSAMLDMLYASRAKRGWPIVQLGPVKRYHGTNAIPLVLRPDELLDYLSKQRLQRS